MGRPARAGGGQGSRRVLCSHASLGLGAAASFDSSAVPLQKSMLMRHPCVMPPLQSGQQANSAGGEQVGSDWEGPVGLLGSW